MQFHIDSWPWKIAVVVALIGMRWFIYTLSPKPVNRQNEEKGQWLIETLDSAAIAVGLVLFVIQPFLLQAFYIPSGSMEDTLQFQPVGDRLLVSKLIYRLREPRFQEVVVFRAPPQAQSEINGQDDFIKRCIGTPGHVIEVRGGVVWRDGKQVSEPYTKWSRNPDLSSSYDTKIVDGVIYSREYSEPGMSGVWKANGVPAPETEQQRITAAPAEAVPPDKFLMLGDHRNNSRDSHVWGFVPRANIVGKAVCVFWPLTRVSLIDRLSFQPRHFAAPATPGSLSSSAP